MRVCLDVPYADAAAEELVWTVGGELRPALASRELPIRGAVVELRLLGASHQVVVAHRAGTLVETVACAPGTSGGLPERQAIDVDGGLTYEFSSVITRPLDFDASVESIASTLGSSSLWGAFPGHPNAITALDMTAGDRSCGWRPWHAYPVTGEIVVTKSRLFL